VYRQLEDRRSGASRWISQSPCCNPDRAGSDTAHDGEEGRLKAQDSKTRIGQRSEVAPAERRERGRRQAGSGGRNGGHCTDPTTARKQGRKKTLDGKGKFLRALRW